MSVHITVAKQTTPFTVKSVVDQTIEGEDAAYTPTQVASPAVSTTSRKKDSLDEPKSCVTE